MITHYLNYNNEKKNKIEKNNKCILKKMNDYIEKDLMNSNNSCGGEDNNNDNHIKNDTSIDENINNINSNQSEDNDDNSNNNNNNNINNNNNNNNNDSNHNKYYICYDQFLDKIFYYQSYILFCIHYHFFSKSFSFLNPSPLCLSCNQNFVHLIQCIIFYNVY